MRNLRISLGVPSVRKRATMLAATVFGAELGDAFLYAFLATVFGGVTYLIILLTFEEVLKIDRVLPTYVIALLLFAAGSIHFMATGGIDELPTWADLMCVLLFGGGIHVLPAIIYFSDRGSKPCVA